jgi:hypothetical protein
MDASDASPAVGCRPCDGMLQRLCCAVVAVAQAVQASAQDARDARFRGCTERGACVLACCDAMRCDVVLTSRVIVRTLSLHSVVSLSLTFVDPAL